MSEQFQFYNPAFGGVGEQRATYNIPSEGELFLTDKNLNSASIAYRLGNTVYVIPLDVAWPEYKTLTNQQKIDKGLTTSGVVQESANKKAAEALGINLNNLPVYPYDQGSQIAFKSATPSQVGSLDEFKNLMAKSVKPTEPLPNMEEKAKAEAPANAAAEAFAKAQPDVYQQQQNTVSPETEKNFKATGAEFEASKNDGRLLKPSEFTNIATNLGKAGLTLDEIEKYAIKRQGTDIYLNSDVSETQEYIDKIKTLRGDVGDRIQGGDYEYLTQKGLAENDIVRQGDTSIFFKPEAQTKFESQGVLSNLPSIKSIAEEKPNINFAEKIAEPGNDIVDGAQSLFDDKANITNQATELKSSIDTSSQNFLDTKSFGETTEGKQALDDLTAIRDSVGILSDEEKASIKAQTDALGGEYDVLVEQAKQSKRQGLAGDIIRMGEKTGMLSTQFSETIGKANDTYDLNIQNLQAKKLSAVTQAKQAAEQAIKTGKQTDLTNAMNLYKIANDAHNQSLNLQKEKLEVQSALRTEQLNLIKTLQSISPNQSITIGGVTYNGMAEVEPFYSSADFINIAKTIPTGSSIVVTDPSTGESYTIAGLMQDDPNTQTFESTDSAGVTTFVTLDKATGKIINQVSAGKIGKGTSGTSNAYKFGTTQKDKLLGAGFTTEDISNIQQNINDGYSIDDIISNASLNPNQEKILRQSFTGETPEELDETTISILIQGAVDDKGNFDPLKLPSDQRTEIISRAEELGYFDLEDEDTRTWLEKIKNLSEKLSPFPTF